MIEPESIPLFTGDLGQLDHHVEALRREAVGIRDAGATAHSQFQGLSAFYEAPEAEDLFASTAPARDAADTFADKVETVAEALSTYAAEVAPIAERLEHLKSRATAFVAGLKTESGEFDAKWNKDADKVEEHQALWHEVHAAQQAFWEAEVACANRITALVGGTQYVLNTGDTQLLPRGAHLYGYSAELLDRAKELPWGTPVTQHHDWWDPRDFDYYVKSFVWDGLIVDNVWGTVDGLFSLAGINGSQEFKDSWTGLARVLVGAETYLMEAASGKKATTGPFATDFAQGSKVYAKEFAKGLVAWDQWDENPARAAATVVFNTVTLGVGPLKAASAGRAGAAAKAATTVAKVGDVLDPLSAAAKAAGHAVPKIAEVTANLRGVGDLAEVRGPHSVLELADGSRLVIEDGRFIAYDKQGNLVEALPKQEHTLAGEGNKAPAQERELTAVGSAPQKSAAAAHAGDPSASRGSDAHATPSHSGAGNGGSAGTTESSVPHQATTNGAGTGHGGNGEGNAGWADGSGNQTALPERRNEPLPELTPEERADHWVHLEQVEARSPQEFDALQRDPDKNGGISEPSKDEARVGLDLREQGRLPKDIRRPTEADQGEFYSPSTGRHYDIKGVHSDWPPFNNVRDKSQPFKGAYDPAKNGRWVKKLEEQIVEKRRIVILDVRNANQAAIDDIKSIVEKNGWEDDVIWYP
ncbi:hypothetical protein AB0K92_13770 [Streptomyces sp. NPDC052687]|uniref:hypothetical protein n=1 Tax=Streptomyces sp. NPDC052687 TaxID=3154759 RepID=UPI003449C03A